MKYFGYPPLKCISFDISLFSALFKRVGVSCLQNFHQLGPLGRSVIRSSCQVYSLLLVKFWLSTRSKELTKIFLHKKPTSEKTSFIKKFLNTNLYYPPKKVTKRKVSSYNFVQPKKSQKKNIFSSLFVTHFLYNHLMLKTFF